MLVDHFRFPRGRSGQLLRCGRCVVTNPQSDGNCPEDNLLVWKHEMLSEAVWWAIQSRCGGGCVVNMRTFHAFPTAGVLLLAPNGGARPFVGWTTEL